MTDLHLATEQAAEVGRSSHEPSMSVRHSFEIPKIPRGLCQCGCGQKTNLAQRNDATLGLVKGEPLRCVFGHKGARPLERLLKYAPDRPCDGCWEWIGPKHLGYGRLGITTGPYRRRSVPAHRLMYEELVGPIPEGLHLDHLCRNRACCNPGHLEPVTPTENILRGESPAAKHAKKTHCPAGHPYAGRNLVFSRDGTKRICRECRNTRSRQRYHARKAQERVAA